MSDALVIAAHGSRDEAGVEEFWALAEGWRALRPDRLQAEGFLEFASPTIGQAIDDVVAQGASRVVVVPAMLMAAGHVKNDVPSEVHEARGRHPGVTLAMARPLDIHPALLELCVVRYREALEGRAEIEPGRTLLLLVGRGTSDPDANANIARVSRFLWEATGAAWASIGFTGVTGPSVDEALTVSRRLGYDRIVVQPYFLFDGILLKRMREAVARHAEADPGVDIVAVPHLRHHPLLLRAFEDRAHEALHGSPNMNCELCKYRVRLVGRESDLGQPQAGHHYAVRAAVEEDDDHGHGPRRRRRRATLPVISESPIEPATHPWDDRLLERLRLIDR